MTLCRTLHFRTVYFRNVHFRTERFRTVIFELAVPREDPLPLCVLYTYSVTQDIDLQSMTDKREILNLGKFNKYNKG